jgi:hypothetical protein
MEKPTNQTCPVAVIYRRGFRKRLMTCAEPVLLGLEDFEIALRDLIAAGLWRLPGITAYRGPNSGGVGCLFQTPRQRAPQGHYPGLQRGNPIGVRLGHCRRIRLRIILSTTRTAATMSAKPIHADSKGEGRLHRCQLSLPTPRSRYFGGRCVRIPAYRKLAWGSHGPEPSDVGRHGAFLI